MSGTELATMAVSCSTIILQVVNWEVLAPTLGSVLGVAIKGLGKNDSSATRGPILWNTDSSVAAS